MTSATIETLVELPHSLLGPGDSVYDARACGCRRADGLWEGWIEFVRETDGHTWSTDTETTQPNRTDLVYWANGLTPVYLEGAFRRASERPLSPAH